MAGANLWRTTNDISDDYATMASIGFSQIGLARFAGPGHWNDPDMLEVGNGGMNLDEYRTHISLWAILAAPLMAGNDLSAMSAATLSLLTNRDVIAVDQDVAGKQGDRVSASGPIEVWARISSGGAQAVGIFNRDDRPPTAHVDLRSVDRGPKVRAKDLWAGKDLGVIGSPYPAKIPAHGVLLLKVWKD